MKKLKKYSANQFTKLLKLLSKYELAADQETLHRIRISIKKIRALFRLISFCEDKFNYRKKFRPLKKIFAEAGIIRNLYIAQNLIDKYGIEFKKEDVDFNSENENRLDLVSAFLKRSKGFQKIIYGIFFDTEKYIENVSPECFREYSNTRMTELRNIIFPDLIEASLHNARKICKEIIFLNEMSYNANKSIDPFYDKLQNMIGEWHDKIELLGLMKDDEKDFKYKNSEEFEKKIVSDLGAIKELTNDYYKTSLLYAEEESR